MSFELTWINQNLESGKTPLVCHWCKRDVTQLTHRQVPNEWRPKTAKDPQPEICDGCKFYYSPEYIAQLVTIVV